MLIYIVQIVGWLFGGVCAGVALVAGQDVVILSVCAGLCILAALVARMIEAQNCKEHYYRKGMKR